MVPHFRLAGKSCLNTFSLGGDGERAALRRLAELAGPILDCTDHFRDRPRRTGVRRRHDAVGTNRWPAKKLGPNSRISPVTLFLRSLDERLNLGRKKGIVPHGSHDNQGSNLACGMAHRTKVVEEECCESGLNPGVRRPRCGL